jgi:hypothetical protein
MTEDKHEEEQTLLPRKKKTRLEKQAEHIDRIKKTLLACIAGILVGALSWYLQVTVKNDIGLLAFMLMLAGVVLQRHIFILLKIDSSKMGAKDWLYQGFMTFAFWIMTWTILLSTTVPSADFTSNITNGTAPLGVAFSDASTNTPTMWNWSFGDGTFSDARNPEKTYASAGNFTVNLTVENAYGTNTLSKTGYITILPAGSS